MNISVRCSRGLVLTFALLVAGCRHTVVLRAAPVGEDVRLTLGQPQKLAVVRPAGDTLPVSAVATVRGRVLSVRDDAIELRVSSLADSERRPIGALAGSRVIVPIAAEPRIEERRLSVTRTAFAFFALSLGVFALGVALGGGGP